VRAEQQHARAHRSFCASPIGIALGRCGTARHADAQCFMHASCSSTRRLTAALGLAGLLIYSAATLVSTRQSTGARQSWWQWGGPDRNFISDVTGLADSWPESGPPRIWSRSLGLGHSSIVSESGMLYTMYRPGNEITRNGPWESRELVIAMEAATGKTLWEHEYRSDPLNFSFGAGRMPHRSSSAISW
jgi:hypothetical protein